MIREIDFREGVGVGAVGLKGAKVSVSEVNLKA